MNSEEKTYPPISGQLEFDDQGNIKRLTYVNPENNEIIILDINADTGEISYPCTQEAILEYDENGNWEKLTYSDEKQPQEIDLITIENKTRENGYMCYRNGIWVYQTKEC
jgi:hypothetical protein